MELTIVSGCIFPESCKHPGCGTNQGGGEARALALVSTRGLWKYSKSHVIQPLSHRSLSAQCVTLCHMEILLHTCFSIQSVT